jgi:hypothetical protein
MSNKLIVDSNSLINFFYYYYSSKNNSSKIFGELLNFLIDKIDSGEVIVIDKVFNEFSDNPEREFLKKSIKRHVKDTLFLFDKVQQLMIEHYREDIAEKYYNGKPIELELEYKKYEEKYADLYLVAYCQYLNGIKEKTILITEENRGDDKKLFEKIPVICVKHNIEYRNLPYSLFNTYKDELNFNLSIKKV